MKKFDFNKIEKKWQKKWEEAGIFEVREDKKKKKFYVLDMFPYPSAQGLHIGHAFVFSLGDIFARFKRMQGFNVLYPIGYDSLGLPAENSAISAGTHPEEYTKKSIANFMKQQKAMGWSYDWSRMVKTSDPEFYKWDQWIFLQMLKRNLAYRKKASVNWCSKCNTVLANEQVIDGKCWRHENIDVQIKLLEQWFLKITDYAKELISGLEKINWPENARKRQLNWVGKSEGTEVLFEINGKKWPVFTTRPDTLFGVTFMVISAQHSQLMEIVTREQKKEVEKFVKKIKSTSEKGFEGLEKEGVFTGSYASNPINGEKVPVYAGNFVVADYGSGMVMAVPAHDQRDFEFAKKYGIPIKQVICRNNAPIRSYLMGASKITDEDLIKLGIKIIETTDNGDRKIEISEDKLKEYERLIIKKLDNGFWNEYIGKEIVFIFKLHNGKTKKLVLNDDTQEEIDKLASEFMKEGRWDKSCVWKWLAENKFYTDLIIHEEYGTLINSKKFNGLNSKEAMQEISKHLEKLNLGKKTIQYKLRDWLISRQRYWGTPIPVVYCDKCGIVPVPEKDLPVVLPKKVKFGEGNPLATNKEFVNVRCPNCREKARRETDTMDTFANSSWYYLRYTDPKNEKKIFDGKKVSYWCPIDQYIGGPEHITMHLIYFRFYTMFLRDIGLLKFDEPALRYFTQGIVHGADGEKMSKSRGNIVEPLDIIEKFGADTLRLALVSLATPDKDSSWDEKIVIGSHKFLNRVYEYFENWKHGKTDARIESKLNKTIKEVTGCVENFKHNIAVIKIRDLFSSFSIKKMDKKTAESFLKLLHVYCPFITEEIWEKMGNKSFVSLVSWPKADEKKINEKYEKIEQAIEKTVSDILNVLKLVKGNKVYLYVLPQEVEFYSDEELSRRTGKEVKVFAVNDSRKYDPQGKSSKAKPCKPGIFVE